MSFKEVSELSSKMDARSHLSFDHILLLALLHSTLNQSESIVFEWKRGGGGNSKLLLNMPKIQASFFMLTAPLLFQSALSILFHSILVF